MSDYTSMSLPPNCFGYLLLICKTLSEQESSKKVVVSGDKITISPQEPIELDFDWRRICTKLTDLMSKGVPTDLVLEDEDFEIFKKATKAAYYYISEQDNPGPQTREYLEWHEHFFRS